MLFRRRPPIDADEWEWQLAAFAWLEREYAGDAILQDRILARPDGDEFPDTDASGHALAEEVLRQVKAIAGVATWPTDLKPMVRRPSNQTLTQGIATAGGAGPAGTFQMVRGSDNLFRAEIHYSDEDIERPIALVGTLGHEIAHYRLHKLPAHGPGGEECEELLTDLTAIWLGFGIMLGNQARYGGHVANEHGQWFVSGSRGYLSEAARMSALAISEARAGRDPMAAAPYLKPHLVRDLRQAARYIERRDLTADLAAIDLADYGC